MKPRITDEASMAQYMIELRRISLINLHIKAGVSAEVVTFLKFAIRQLCHT